MRSMSSAASRSASAPIPDDFKKLLGQAINLRNQERYGEAAQLLERLRETNPGSASVHALLADALWEQQDLAGAIHSFRRAVELSPRSEKASLGLFHTLWESGDKAAAVAEMRRYLSVADSD